MENLLQDLRYSIRLLTKHPGFTAVMTLTLALGIGANSAMFSVINAVLLRPLPYKDAERIVTLWESNAQPGLDRTEVSPPNFVDWSTQSRSFEQMAAFRYWGFVFTGTGEPERLRGARVSASLFPLLGVQASQGRIFLPEEDRFGNNRVVLLSHGLWQRRFGALFNVVGQTLILNGESYTVIGVLPTSFRLPEADLWVPLALEPYTMTQRGSRSLTVLARLKPTITLTQAQVEMNTIARRLQQHHPEANTGWGISLTPLHEQMVSQVRPALLVLLGAVGVVLLIACANMANLLLARLMARQQEIALRTALGASQVRLIRQLLTESVLLALLSGAAGLLVAQEGIDLLVVLSPTPILRAGEIGIDRDVFMFTLLMSLLTGVAVGVVPALHASKPDLNALLKEGRSSITTGVSRARFRNLVVVFEVAMALILLIGAGLLLRSFIRLQAVELGFNPERVLTMTISLPETRYPEGHQKMVFYQQLLDRVHALPGAMSAGLVGHLPLAGSALRSDFILENRPLLSSGEVPSADYINISPEYFRVLGIPLLKGRLFTDRDSMGASQVVVINEALARRFWSNEDPIGHRLRLGATLGADQRPREIVGIVGNIRSTTLESEPSPTIYVPYFQNPWPTMSLVVQTASDPIGLAAVIRSQVLALDSEQPVYNVRTLEQVLARSLAPRRFQMFLLVVFALVALTLAAIGVYGVMSYVVTLRTHEIGVRMALGAQQRDVLKLVVGQGMGWVVFGVIIGCAAAFGVARLLTTMLFGVTPTDPVTFVGVSVFLLIVAFLASYLPARRAMHVDPLVALRYE
jgi:putative ABC transport system permease protein